jgi:hypothetical protein
MNNRRVRGGTEKVANVEKVKIEESFFLDIPKPETELEYQLSRRLGWDKYHFQFPDVTRYIVKKIRRLNVELEQIEYTPTQVYFKKKDKHNKFTAWTHFDNPALKNELHVRFAEYCRKLDLPLDFKKRFPYLWTVLQDQYLVNSINTRNLKRMRRKLKGLVRLNLDYSTIIFYQHFLIRQMREYDQIRQTDLFFRDFVDNISALLKLIYTKGMREETFNELVDSTIEILKHIKTKNK